MKNGTKWAHDSSSKTIWNWMCCDRSATYVALSVAAPHFESVWNCEPVRLLMTQYIIMCICTIRRNSYSRNKLNAWCVIRCRHKRFCEKETRVKRIKVEWNLRMCCSNTNEIHMTIKRRRKLAELRWLLAKLANRCSEKSHNTLKSIWESTRRNSFQGNVTFHFELCDAWSRSSNTKYACHLNGHNPIFWHKKHAKLNEPI